MNDTLHLVKDQFYETKNSRLYSPSELSAINQHNANIYETRQEKKRAELAQEERNRTNSGRPLTADEYHQLAIEKEQKKRTLEISRELQAAADEQARQDFLESNPPVVNICEPSPVPLLLNLQHWIGKGYNVDITKLTHFTLGCYAVSLTAPSKI
ncbi:hypothetical protein [Herbaspirillum robiniae]|uniref:hypothetical protein n=1 Tax=Herbaspirillum robiniae TaxID=2014887 RepID=UPI0011E4CDCC|nr:hypothetical protein [Herbaspirillum robiniae]